MSEKGLTLAALLMAVVVLVAMGWWEFFLRKQGIPLAYDDNGDMWSDKRAKVYQPDAVVFIGSSRIKYDLDVDTWQELTGRPAIELALEGHSPLPFLIDLGNDPRFKGRLVIDVTEVLYFSDAPAYSAQCESYVHHYWTQTPAQRASFVVDHALESQFVFLDEKFLSLNALLDDHLHFADRPGVQHDPKFPLEFWRQDFSRQTKMAPAFLTDTNLQKEVTDVWSFFLDLGAKMPPPKIDPAPGIIAKSKEAVNKIRARGGEVVFVRTPSSGKFWAIEQVAFPRQRYWEPLLKATQCQGFFFTDYSCLSKYVPIEWSHLDPQSAKGFTKGLVKVLPASFTTKL